MSSSSPTETVSATIAVFAGDGVGPEVVAEARKVLDAVASRFGCAFNYRELLIGGIAIDTYGIPLRDEDIETARAVDACLLGAVGGPKWDDPDAKVRPEQGLLRIRKSLGLYANLRPVAVLDALLDATSLKPEVLKGTDLIVVRELTGGLYFGRPSHQWRERRGRAAVDTLVYHELEIERIARLAFELARTRRGKLTSVDKANVLSSSRLWRAVVSEVSADYPEIDLEHMLIDAMTMKLIQQPSVYDVIVTENMFGDILTDEASVLGGSIGVLPSASLGAAATSGKRAGLYEPIHGSAPDIAGLGKANPVGMILSAAMMLRMSLGLDDEASAVERAVFDTIASGLTTPDLRGGTATTSSFGDMVASRVAGI
ncbi:MAG: 3-isopropylmalate dehydrogenase [Chloroflexia bacterium]|nr:3-isopropylmalate dehydrogenase [Chloroflexia bacterium]